MDEENEDDGLEWDKPQEFLDKSPEKELRNGKSVVKRCLPKMSHPRVILHIDIDCFYAQVEMIRNPTLRNKPLGIQQKYIVVTCNYPAREYGVTKLMSIKDAKEKCPSLVLVNGEDLTHYRQMSYKISEYLQQFCPSVERLGFDENFLDITDLVNDRLANQSGENLEGVMGHVYGEEPSVLGNSCSCGCHERLRAGSHIAADIREGLFKELGITCCGGIAHNKLLSKLVAGSHKPSQQTTLFPEHTGTLMGSLKSARNIPGIGHSSSKQLQELGVVSVCDLQDAELALLKKVFGETAATHMQQLAHGVDESPVVAFSLPQTLSDEDSFKKCSSVLEVERKIKELLNSLLKRLLEDGRTPTTLRLTVRKMTAAGKYLGRESRQCPIPNAVFGNFSKERIPQTSGQLQVLAMALFNKLVNLKEPFHLTLINVAFAKMEEKSKNAITNFFSPQSIKQQDVRRTGKDSLELGDSRGIKSVTSSLDGLNASCFDAGSKDEMSGSEEIRPVREEMNKSVKLLNKDLRRNSGKRNSLTEWLSSAEKDLEQESWGPDTLQNSDHENKNATSVNIKISDSQLIDESEEHIAESRNLENDKTFMQKRKNSETECAPDTESNADGVPKRQRLTENFDELIPEHIDKAVFYQLPPSIQQEILTSGDYDGNVGSVDVNESQNEIIQYTGIPRIEKVKFNARNLLLDTSSTARQDISQTQVTATPQDKAAVVNTSTPKTVKSPNTGFFKSKAMNRSGMILDTRPSGDQHNVVKDLRQIHAEDKTDDLQGIVGGSGLVKPGPSRPDSKHNAKLGVFIPPNIDRETFLSLPSDIQWELVSEWKTKEQTEKKPLQTSYKPPHFKMPEKSSRNTILSYFSKANK